MFSILQLKRVVENMYNPGQEQEWAEGIAAGIPLGRDQEDTR